MSCALAVLACNGEEARHPQHFAVAAMLGQQEAQWAARRQRMAGAIPKIDALLGRQVKQNRMPSLLAGVLVDGHLIWWRGYGVRDLQSGGAVTPHTVYRIGSVTKTITAMALLKLRDEGRMSLDMPAATFLPEFDKVIYPTHDSPLITLRHLVTHTSGLPRLGKFDYAKPRSTPVSEREVLESLRGVALKNTPGVKNVYSNFGYALLGIIIGRIADMPYHDYVSRHLLVPLGMTSARWHHDDVPHDQLATGYSGADDKPLHHWLMGASEGMGGLYASLDDMVRYVAFQMTAWPPGARPNRAPIANASLRESHMLGGFQAPGRGGTGIGWGTSVFSKEHGVFHTGATHQYVTSVAFLPHKRIAFIGMSNAGRVTKPVDRLGGIVLRMLLREVGELP